MLEFRLKSLDHFPEATDAELGQPGNLAELDFDEHLLLYRAGKRKTRARPGMRCRRTSRIPSTSSVSRRRRSKFLAGVGAQYESEVIYHSLREDLAKSRVCMFLDMDAAVRENSPEIVQEVLRHHHPLQRTTSSPRSTRPSGRVAPSSTSPKGSRSKFPLQAYFRINAENMGQFERTLIICAPLAPTCTMSKAVPLPPTQPTAFTRR